LSADTASNTPNSSSSGAKTGTDAGVGLESGAAAVGGGARDTGVSAETGEAGAGSGAGAGVVLRNGVAQGSDVSAETHQVGPESRRLEAQNLHLWRGDRHVLQGVSFSVGPGECLQITGSNGAGKTSLLRTLNGLMYPEEGHVLWGGQNIRDDLQGFHGNLAYIGHEPPLKVDFTARENIHYWIGIRWPVSRAEIDEALERVGASTWSDRPIRTLSAGQKRRVALAGLTLMVVPVWLLDEPTTNLDREGQHLVGTLIEEHLERGGLAVAAIHHELSVRATALRRLELARG
jgi:heme exporter protein A